MKLLKTCYPFRLFISSTAIDPKFLKKTTKIAKPIAASAAATVKINIVNICPVMSWRYIENETRFILTAKRISSTDIKITITFFLFKKIPSVPSEKMIAPKVK